MSLISIPPLMDIICILFTCGTILLPSARASENNTTTVSPNTTTYSISLLYPLTSAQKFNFFHSFGGFLLAVQDANKMSKAEGNDIYLDASITDTAANPQNSIFGITPQGIEWQTLKLIADRSINRTDAFIGPGIKNCACDAKLVAAYKKAMVGYVSFLKLFVLIFFVYRKFLTQMEESVFFRTRE